MNSFHFFPTKIKVIFSFIFLILFTFSCHAQSLTHEEENRLSDMSKKIRCIVCENESIAESSAPLAHDLKVKIAGLIHEKKSDAEIKQFLIKRYGEFILFETPYDGRTFLLWISPALIFLTGCIIFYNSYQKPRKKLCQLKNPSVQEV